MSYPGGKAGAGVKQKIINLMPPHRVYIEPFLGNGAIMKAKKPALLNIGLDLDEDAPGLSWMSQKRSHTPILGDGIQYLKDYNWEGDELVYCDPPYLMSTRTGKRLYKWEWWVDRHRTLINLLRSLPCKVMLSGYESSLYREMLVGWPSIQFEAMTRGGHTKTEWLWMNFEPPTVLHDYQHLGAGFRERERIKRKKARWVSRLARMDPLERHAILEILLETSSPPTPSTAEGQE